MSSPDNLNCYQKLVNQADELYIVADSSKFDKTSMLHFAAIDGIEKMITNENIPSSYKELFYNSNIQLFSTITTE